jgi:DNA polymerase III alpha subunit (gram-positive type)
MKHLIFDTETTGLLLNSAVDVSRQPRIIEFCGQLYNDKGRKLAELDELYHPGKLIIPKITEITGITNEMLSKKEPIEKKGINDITKIIGEADVVVGHNLRFDMDMVNNEMKRTGTTLNWPVRQVCTIEQTRHLKGFALNLGSLHELLFGEPHSGAHRALADVEALARCYFELKKRKEI